jgi:hypothetical protein
MTRRSGWHGLVLALMLTLVALPAMAGERPSGRAGGGRGFVAVWRAVVRWVAPAEWLAKLGPGMDPDGLTGRTVPPGGSTPSGQPGDLGPDMDPNG